MTLIDIRSYIDLTCKNNALKGWFVFMLQTDLLQGNSLARSMCSDN